jgi:hypothetical protein
MAQQEKTQERSQQKPQEGSARQDGDRQLAQRDQRDQRDQNNQQERYVQSRYLVRQVTGYQASWMEQERGEEGMFAIQLILDHGIEEYTLEVNANDLDGLLTLMKRSKHTMFDLDRKVLMFANLHAC